MWVFSHAPYGWGVQNCISPCVYNLIAAHYTEYNQNVFMNCLGNIQPPLLWYIDYVWLLLLGGALMIATIPVIGFHLWLLAKLKEKALPMNAALAAVCFALWGVWYWCAAYMDFRAAGWVNTCASEAGGYTTFQSFAEYSTNIGRHGTTAVRFGAAILAPTFLFATVLGVVAWRFKKSTRAVPAEITLDENAPMVENGVDEESPASGME